MKKAVSRKEMFRLRRTPDSPPRSSILMRHVSGRGNGLARRRQPMFLFAGLPMGSEEFRFQATHTHEHVGISGSLLFPRLSFSGWLFASTSCRGRYPKCRPASSCTQRATRDCVPLATISRVQGWSCAPSQRFVFNSAAVNFSRK